MKVITIRIESVTESDAELALEQVRKAIQGGYCSAPWNSDGDKSGYSFTTTGEWE